MTSVGVAAGRVCTTLRRAARLGTLFSAVDVITASPGCVLVTASQCESSNPSIVSDDCSDTALD